MSANLVRRRAGQAQPRLEPVSGELADMKGLHDDGDEGDAEERDRDGRADPVLRLGNDRGQAVHRLVLIESEG